MKKLLTVACTLLLAAGLAFAQDTGGDKATKTTTMTTHTKKGATSKTKKSHKGTKKQPTNALNPQPLPPKVAPPTTTTPQ
jgi:hypothetical protein